MNSLLIFGHFNFIDGFHWNWSGKLLSITWSFIFIYFNKSLSVEAIGLTVTQKPGANGQVLICILLSLLAIPIALLVDGPRPFDLETLLFQATMPGLDEELAFRGILLALFLKLSDKTIFQKTGFEQPISLLSMALIFSSLHAFSIDENYTPHVNWISGLFTLYYGYLWGWITLKTRSLLIPLIWHHESLNLMGSKNL